MMSLIFSSSNKTTINQGEIQNLVCSLSAKTLELRYSTTISLEKEVVHVHGKDFKVFSSKKRAVEYYYFIKEHAPEKVVYYIVSSLEKDDETYTFNSVD